MGAVKFAVPVACGSWGGRAQTLGQCRRMPILFSVLGQESARGAAPAVPKAAEQSSPGVPSPAANGDGDDGYFDLAAADNVSGTNNENEDPSTASPVVDKDGYMHWGAAQANDGAEPAGSEASAPALHASAPEMSTLNQIPDEGAARNEPASSAAACRFPVAGTVFFPCHLIQGPASPIHFMHPGHHALYEHEYRDYDATDSSKPHMGAAGMWIVAMTSWLRHILPIAGLLHS
jgi:hypothetical protein